MVSDGWVYIPVIAVAAAFVVISRWLVALSKQVREQGERIAHLEGRENGNDAGSK